MATEPAQATCMDPMLQHLLESNLQKEVVTQELTQNLRIAMQELHHPSSRSLPRSPAFAHQAQQ